MIHSPNGFCPRVPHAKQDSGRVQYWIIWSLGQRNKFISHPTTAIRQLTFGGGDRALTGIATLFWNQTTSGLEDDLTLDVLEYRRRRGVIIQSERLGFVIEDDLGGERRFALSQSFGVHPDFDKRELVVGWSSGCDRFPTRRTGTEAPIRREDDAFAAIRQGDAIGVLNRIPDYFLCPKVSDSWRFTDCGRQHRNGICGLGRCSIATAAASTTATAASGLCRLRCGILICLCWIALICPRCCCALISTRSAATSTAAASSSGAPPSVSSCGLGSW